MAGCIPTEEFVLSAAKTSSLETIEILKLDNFNIEHLDPEIFKKLTSLKTLDLSGNKLRDFPDLELKHLTLLDLSDNKLTSLSFLKKFPKLEDVYVEGNPLKKDEKYLVAMESKSLKYIDDTSIDTYTSLAADFEDRLFNQIEGVWEATYGDKYNKGIPCGEVDSVKEKFLKGLEEAKLEGAVNDLPRFTQFMVQRVGTELFHLIRSNKYEPPCKKRRIAAANNTLVSARKVESDTPSRRLSILPPRVADYDPEHFIRCHFGGSKSHGDNDPTDNETIVWRCEFEPDPQNAGKDTGVVATCGGNIVCLIDAKTGRILKRFKQDKDGGQNFFTLAWTTLEMKSGGRKWRSNVLAAGGINGEVHLLHPDQLVSYSEFSICQRMQDYCTALYFHPMHPTILFCGDDTGRFISVWDIDVPKGEDYHTTQKKLCQFRMNGTCTNEIAFCKKTNHLLVACTKGLFAWNLGTNIPRKDRGLEIELILPTPKGNVDGLTVVSENLVACKVVEHGCIYLWRPSTVFKGKQSLRGPTKLIVRTVAVLDWKSTSRMYMGLGARNGLLTCGDDCGRIWLYNIQDVEKQKSRNNLLKPSRILDWPECDTTSKRDWERRMTDLNDNKQEFEVTSAKLSSDGRYIIASTTNNMVCTWRRSES